MCHSCRLNNKIDKLHARCVRLKYTDKTLAFQDSSVSVYMRNIQTLATEMCKVTNDMKL